MYAEARSRLQDARRCFDWAGGASLDMRELQRVASDLEVMHATAHRGAREGSTPRTDKRDHDLDHIVPHLPL